MYFLLFEKQKILVFYNQRVASGEIFHKLTGMNPNFFAKKYDKLWPKNYKPKKIYHNGCRYSSNGIICESMQTACNLNLYLIGKKEGNKPLNLGVIDTINKIPIEDFFNYKIFFVIKNPYHKLFSFFFKEFLLFKRFGRFGENYTFNKFVNEWYNYRINEKTTSKDWPYTFRWLLRRQTEIYTTKIDYKPEKWFKKEFVKFVSDLYNKEIKHPFFKVIDVGNLDKLLEELKHDLKIDIKKTKNIEKFTTNIKKHTKKLFNMTLYNLVQKYTKDRDNITGKFKEFFKVNPHKNQNIESTIPIPDFYNEELKQKIYKVYEQDFNIFEKHGFNYDI